MKRFIRKFKRNIFHATVKTPIVSLALSSLVFFTVFFVASNTVVGEYYDTKVELIADENGEKLIYFQCDENTFYTKPEEGIWFVDKDSNRYECVLESMEEDGDKMTYYYKPDVNDMKKEFGKVLEDQNENISEISISVLIKNKSFLTKIIEELNYDKERN